MQVSLRHLFVTLTFIAIIVALGVWGTEDYRREQFIRNDLLSKGAHSVDVSIEGGRRAIRVTFDSLTISPDVTKYQDTNMVCLRGVSVHGNTVRALTGFRNLTTIQFDHCVIADQDDLQPLLDCKSLWLVIFSNCAIDQSAIEGLRCGPNLKEVAFCNCQIPPDAIQDLASSYPNVRCYQLDALSGATTKVRFAPEPTSSTLTSGIKATLREHAVVD